ncbi:MAG TPA: two-component regulator propeller domain-containing protein [Pyrinomonadaceae bacterium]
MRSLNTCHKRQGTSYQAVWFLISGLLLGVCFVSRAFGLDPDRAMSQYTHDYWGAGQGLAAGPVYAIAQTKDGYLWLGTEKGLFRFDGSRFVLFRPDEGSKSETESVTGLAVDAEGNLWIRMRSPKVFRYRDGKFEDVFARSKEGSYRITAMSRAENGDILLSKFEKGLYRYGKEDFVNLLEKPQLPPSVIISLAETKAGVIWMGTSELGLFRLGERRSLIPASDGLRDRKINCLLPDENENLWVGTDSGIAFWDGARIVEPELAAGLKSSRVLKILKDNQSNLWVATESDGLIRLNRNGQVSTKAFNFPSNKMVTALFEDREGNLWVGTTRGVERLRDNAFMSYSSVQGLPSNSGGALYIDSQGKTWFSPPEGGLYWLKDNSIGSVRAAGIDNDVIYSITGGGSKDELWLGRQRGGLTRLNLNGGSHSIETFTRKDGLTQDSIFTVFQSSDKSVWAGTLTGGVSRLKDGSFTTYTQTESGLASNTINAITENGNGVMWFATPRGLNSLKNDRWRMYSTKDGLPSEKVTTIFADNGGILWVGTSRGLAFLKSGQVHVNRNMPLSLRETILGIAADEIGSLWIETSKQVLRVDRGKLLQGEALRDEDVREFSLADGLLSVEGVKRDRSVTADRRGRMWLSLNQGISVVDPKRLKENSVPALVHIENVSADGVLIGSKTSAQIPAGSRRIVISYAGLSLTVPERVKFRYRLEGFDKDWGEPTNAAEAVFTNLPPGPYRFRVIASNADGAWNSDEAMIEINVDPMYWETWWFRILSAVGALLALLGLYQYRLRRLTRELNFRFAERLAERTRIAQELHDTLLQGVFSASVQLDAVVKQLPDNSDYKPRLNRVQELTKQIMTEGRNTIRGLRSQNSENSLILEQAFATIRRDLDVREQIDFRVIVDGVSQPLRPLVRDEIYRIGREGLINAFKHSKADAIEVRIEYAPKYFRLSVRDNGCGVNAEILQKGRKGHLGLSGMREGAEKLGAKVKIWNRVEGGTEIELIVPQHVAFERGVSEGWLKRLKIFNERKSKMQFSEREQNQ